MRVINYYIFKPAWLTLSYLKDREYYSMLHLTKMKKKIIKDDLGINKLKYNFKDVFFQIFLNF